ncbi:MAG: hypothetical protein ACYDA6_10570 [Solirubrobacteraceae bacterium]
MKPRDSQAIEHDAHHPVAARLWSDASLFAAADGTPRVRRVHLREAAALACAIHEVFGADGDYQGRRGAGSVPCAL